MNGNRELTEMENVIFYVSYGAITEFLRMNVILTYFATETAMVTDTERWKSGIIRKERQCDNYNPKSHRRCNNMSRMNLYAYVGHVTIFRN